MPEVEKKIEVAETAEEPEVKPGGVKFQVGLG